ncbi:MAG: peptidylprolyl isomerase [Bryobacteraceae bacterium]
MLRRFVVLMAAALPMAVAADVKVVEEIAAKINNDIITRGELEHRRQEIEQELRRQGLTGAKLADAVKQAERDALRDQIDQLLLVQRGKDLDIKVDADVARRLAELQVQNNIRDPDKFQEFIRQQTGMTYEDFKQQLTNQILTQKVVGSEIGSRIAISDEEMQKYYEEHKKDFVREEQVFLSQILISTEGKTPDQIAAAEKKAKDMTERGRKGEKFSDLARDNSDDTETAKAGGYIGGFKKGLLLKQIEDNVFKQKKGYVSDPLQIEKPACFLVLKVEERFEAGQASLDEVKNEIEDRLREPKMEPKVRGYLTRLREEAFLQIKDGYIDSGAAPGKDTRWQDVAQLKPQTTTKEEVASRIKNRRKLFGLLPIPGTNKPLAPVTEASVRSKPAKPERPPSEPKPLPPMPPIRQ